MQPFSLSAFQPFSPSKVHGVSKPAGKVVGGEVPGTLLNWGSYSVFGISKQLNVS